MRIIYYNTFQLLLFSMHNNIESRLTRSTPNAVPTYIKYLQTAVPQWLGELDILQRL